MFEGRDSRMTQQSGADDRGEGAAQDVATQSAHTYRLDPPGEGQPNAGRAVDIEPVLAQRPSPQSKGAMSMEMRTDLAQLESAFPAFSFTICKGWDGPRIEAWRDTPLSGLYAIITDDPRELWRELNMAVR
jgi:hypothetical protein